MCWALLVLSAFAFSFSFAFAQGQSAQDSWSHVYPGMPAGDYSPEWQNYFQVTDSLPNVTWPLARNWAGSIPVQRPGHPNNTLFFWAFEASDGSFTSECDEPWAIWLNGGPGGSSLWGLLFENGPLHISNDYSAIHNQYAWSTIVDHVWIDQPVGTGFSTVDADGLAADEDQIATDFMGFLENLVKVFPNLATRPLYIAGESYAGTYIPYITKAYFGMKKPPVNLARIAMGDGTLLSLEALAPLPVITILETYPQIIGYDTQVFEYFQEQSKLCGYDLTLQYPQPAHFPTLNAPIPPGAGAGSTRQYAARMSKRHPLLDIQERLFMELKKRNGVTPKNGERHRARNAWKRNLSGRANGTIDPWYLCDLYDEMIQYALNFTFPWSSGHDFNEYNIPDALSPQAPADATVFLNDARTRAAIHAPMSKDWVEYTIPVFAPTDRPTNPFGDPSVEPMAFLTELATNATAKDMKIVIYSGNDDSLVSHFSSQIAIQNTTFGGIQGFSRKPETPWNNDAGEFAGIVHQERGWTYVLVAHAGHFVPYTNPISALTLAREFIFGNNPTGLVTGTGLGTVVVGGEEPSLRNEALRGQAGIYYGQATTASTYFFPAATVKAWDNYMSTATASPTGKPAA